MTRLESVGLAAALLLAAALMIPLRGYLTDDTFIHLQYARHLAEGQGPVFNPGERVYGCTSPLWAGLLALGIRLGWDGLAVARVLGAAATLASVVLFFQLARRGLSSPALRVIATLGWACHAWMLRWSLSGMETPLAVALTLAGFVALASTEPWGRHPARVSLWWSLAALARPEAVLLLLLWGVATAIDRSASRAPGKWAVSLLPALLVYGGWLLFAGLYYGSVWPRTLAAKTAGSAGLEGELEILRRGIGIVGATDGVLAVLLAAALVLGPRARLGRPSATALVPWAWVLGVPVLYLARGVPVLSRYLLPLLPVLAWLAWRAAESWWRPGRGDGRAGGRALALAGLTGALVIGQNLATWRLLVVPQVTSFTRGMEQSLIPFGRWLGAHAPPGAVVATPDIGAIGYYSQRPVLDLGGLVTPRMIPLLEQRPFEEVVARFAFLDFARPSFVVDRGPLADDLLRRSPYARALTPLDSAAVPNLGIARPGRVVYTLYRVDLGRLDTLVRGR